jgi:hypothetical protein
MLVSALFGEDPQPGRHRRLMTYMLAVATFQIRYPVMFLILMKTDDLADHGEMEAAAL